MQLLIPHPSQVFASSPSQLLESLQDIAHNVRIKSNFCISHPNYKLLELPEKVVERFQQFPLDLQSKYLSLQLRGFLYGLYYNGSLQEVLKLESDAVDISVHQNLENNTYLGINLEFYGKLHASNCGNGYFNPGWLVVNQEKNGTLAIKRGGLTLHIEPEQHLQPTERSASIGDSVAIQMPRNLFQNGFYVAVGNAGLESPGNSNTHSQTVRVYFNLSPEGAVTIMANLTAQLNALNIPFSFKALYNPSDYGRYDSAVLYFERNHYESIHPILQKVYASHQFHFQPEVPLFTKWLAPGLSLAEEPDCKFVTKESFGLNRCQIVANGLLEAWEKGYDSAEIRMDFILQHFAQLGINWQQPYLNANSEDIYRELDL
jgi:hypothetical protein